MDTDASTNNGGCLKLSSVRANDSDTAMCVGLVSDAENFWAHCKVWRLTRRGNAMPVTVQTSLIVEP